MGPMAKVVIELATYDIVKHTLHNFVFYQDFHLHNLMIAKNTVATCVLLIQPVS